MVTLCHPKDAGCELSFLLSASNMHFMDPLHAHSVFFSDPLYGFWYRYPKVNDSIVNCGVGRKTKFLRTEENNFLDSVEVYGFYGQIGPVYLFSDAISPEHVQGIYSLGPSYMYSFLDNEASLFHDELLRSGVLDARDGLTSKIVFGLNAQVFLLFIDHLISEDSSYFKKLKTVPTKNRNSKQLALLSGQ